MLSCRYWVLSVTPGALSAQVEALLVQERALAAQHTILVRFIKFNFLQQFSIVFCYMWLRTGAVAWVMR